MVTVKFGEVVETAVEGGYVWTLSSWGGASSAEDIVEEFRVALSSALLAVLSRPARDRALLGREYIGVEWYQCGESIAQESMDALMRGLGFSRRSRENIDSTSAVERMRGMALEHGEELSGESIQVWEAPVAFYTGAYGQQLWDMQRMMYERMDDALWGEQPGGPSKLFAGLVRNLLGAHVGPNREGLSTMELLLVQDSEVHVRWMPPLLFQALCDFVGILLRTMFRVEVEWAVSEELGGVWSVPQLSVRHGEKRMIFPVGDWLLGCCVLSVKGKLSLVESLENWYADELTQ